MKPREKRLLRWFARLDPGDQDTLLAFAEFLAERTPSGSEELAAPVLLPRPEKETVISAIRRLSASYPMLDKATMLNQTSSLMTQHVLQSRPAPEVIDELEELFRREYERLRDQVHEAPE